MAASKAAYLAVTVLGFQIMCHAVLGLYTSPNNTHNKSVNHKTIISCQQIFEIVLSEDMTSVSSVSRCLVNHNLERAQQINSTIKLVSDCYARL